MKYAREVIELMAAYPGRDFKMAELVNYVAGSDKKDVRKVRAIRKGVLRVIQSLAGTGTVMVRSHRVHGGYATYRWQ